MNMLEYKVVCLIIDKHTRKVDGGHYQSDYKEIDEEGITAIKNEIKKELVEGEKEKKND